MCGPLAWARTCPSAGCWSGRAPAGCCGSPLIGWMAAGAPACWLMRLRIVCYEKNMKIQIHFLRLKNTDESLLNTNFCMNSSPCDPH